MCTSQPTNHPSVHPSTPLPRETVDKLVRAFGYPPSLMDLEFDHSFMMRGLIVDKQRGNIIKVGWGWVRG